MNNPIQSFISVGLDWIGLDGLDWNTYEDIVVPEQHRHLTNNCEDSQLAGGGAVATRSFFIQQRGRSFSDSIPEMLTRCSLVYNVSSLQYPALSSLEYIA